MTISRGFHPLVAIRGLFGMSFIVSGCFLSGCAVYQSKPLEESGLDRALAVPEPSRLIQAAAQLHHPRLAPITLDFSKPWTDEGIGVLAVLVSPDLKALRARQQVAEAQVFAAGLLPDPRFTARFDFPIGGVPTIFHPYTVGPSWDLAKLATRGTDQRIAEAQAQRVHDDVAWQEWLVANQAQLLARRLAYLHRQETLARDAADVAARLLELTKQNVEAGDAKITDLGLREAAFLDARDRALALARQHEKTRQDLNRLVGMPPDRPLPIADINSSPFAEKDPVLLYAQAKRQRLDLRALQAGYASQEASLYRAILGQFPAFSLGMVGARSTGGVETGGPSISFDIPILNRNRGGIAIAEATREQLYQEYVARLNQTRADIATLAADLKRIAAEREPLVQELPQLARAEQIMREAAATGDVTLLSYETVRANFLDKQLKLMNLEQAAAEQEVALQLAVGSSFVE